MLSLFDTSTSLLLTQGNQTTNHQPLFKINEAKMPITPLTMFVAAITLYIVLSKQILFRIFDINNDSNKTTKAINSQPCGRKAKIPKLTFKNVILI